MKGVCGSIRKKKPSICLFSSIVASSMMGYFAYTNFTYSAGKSVDLATTVFGEILVHKYLSQLFSNYFGFSIIWDHSSLTTDGKLCLLNVTCTGSSNQNPPCSFDFSIGNLVVELSPRKFLFEKSGIIKSLDIDGVTGTITQDGYFDYSSGIPYKFPYAPNSLFIEEHVHVSNLNLFFQYPEPYKSFDLLIFEAQLPRLSSYMLMYDILQAHYIRGEYDGSPFVYAIPSDQDVSSNYHINRPDKVKFTPQNESLLQFRKLLIEKVSISHFREHTSSTGIFNLLSTGAVDINAVISLPCHFSFVEKSPTLIGNALPGRVEEIPDQVISPSITKVLLEDNSEVLSLENMLAKKIFSSSKYSSFANTFDGAQNTILSFPDLEIRRGANQNLIGFWFHVTLRNLSLADHFFNQRSLSMGENLLLRFVAESRRHVPVSFSFEMSKTEDFSGVWTPYNSGLTRCLKKSFTYALTKYFEAERSTLSFYLKFGAWSASSLLSKSSLIFSPTSLMLS
ncbi:Mitochondrial distribution and morphology protein 31 [Mitosporidium daphniae]